MNWYYWLIIAFCSLLSMFFSSADMVYSAVNVDRLALEAEKGNKRAEQALKIANDYEFSIASILFGNSLVNIVASSLITAIGINWNQEWGVTVLTICFTVFLIIFAEFAPKSISKKYSFKLSLLYVYPVTIFKYMSAIIVWPIAKLFHLFGKLFAKKKKEEEEIDEDVLSEMVDEIEESGALEEEEAEIVRNSLDIHDVEAHEIMTPRVDVYAIDVEDDINEIIKEGEIFKHSRIPVYEETIDNIIGILPIKALANAIYRKEENIDIRPLLYKPLFVPRNRQLLDLLEEFKTTKIHIALVMDEYGGVEGIVTMEDILEEIVGDIFDETDDFDEEYVEAGDGEYIVDGGMNIEDFFELIGYEDEFETDYETVGGLCQEILDRFAKQGDEFMFQDRYKFIILDADEYTTNRIKVIDTKFEKEEDDE